ncbi:hypothetical protein, partial [Escherichia coli]|uniref:hypothetical protein n=1 Tax=Escherichia coli TaxID=562 RepID=UPI001BDDB3F9
MYATRAIFGSSGLPDRNFVRKRQFARAVNYYHFAVLKGSLNQFGEFVVQCFNVSHCDPPANFVVVKVHSL